MMVFIMDLKCNIEKCNCGVQFKIIYYRVIEYIILGIILCLIYFLRNAKNL